MVHLSCGPNQIGPSIRDFRRVQFASGFLMKGTSPSLRVEPFFPELAQPETNKAKPSKVKLQDAQSEALASLLWSKEEKRFGSPLAEQLEQRAHKLIKDSKTTELVALIKGPERKPPGAAGPKE
jgi:hypothetical protein